MRLNVGSGGQVAEGWTCLDRGFTPETIAKAREIGDGATLMQFELTDLPLPFGDGSVSQAVAHHSLCMLADPDLRALLGEVHRVLEPGGILRVSSVDFQYAIRALARQDRDWFYDLGVPDPSSQRLRQRMANPSRIVRLRTDGTVVEDTDKDSGVTIVNPARDAFIWYLDWGGARETVLVSPEHLGVEYLAPAGFAWEPVAMNETVGPPGICDFDSREDESWFLDARKP